MTQKSRFRLRATGLALLLVLSGTALTGCGFVAGLFGIQFETYYSPEQREVFRTNVQLGLNNLSDEVPPFTPAELRELDDSGITICENLRNFTREEVKERLIEEVLNESPFATESDAGRFAEVFLQASTAQGSLCSELR